MRAAKKFANRLYRFAAYGNRKNYAALRSACCCPFPSPPIARAPLSPFRKVRGACVI